MDPAGSAVYDGSEIALVGMACRFPGASDPETFWHNLRQGIESLTELSDEDLLRGGVEPEMLQSPQYVRKGAVLEDIERFDAEFFGFTPHEARITDPQHRLFLECAWESLERGGYDPFAYPGLIGVFTGAKTNTYLLNLFSNRDLFRSLDNFQIALGNDLASMATRTSYKLDLRGPSYALHTACSTSLVTVHLACQSLLLGECDMALAGGAAVNVPQRKGYLYQKGGILSPDGSCRTFDENAAGSNFGNGVGCVLLKRLDDALEAGDHIHAIIRGSATNNDGALKASYTAPGVEGQTSVLLEAMACGGVDAETISYVEAHGTATELGDAIEILALKQAFEASTAQRGFCGIGSVKTNVGHLETAAGVAGLIKTALSLEHREIPPSLHFEQPNPKLGLEDSPFHVITELQPWKRGDTPRRAGVSSFGIGSTNAHVILEEAPTPRTSEPARPWQLLLLSSRTDTALDAMAANLGRHLREHPEQTLADVAYTLQVGRRRFPQRRMLVARDSAEAAEILESGEGDRGWTLEAEGDDRPVVFLFPGLGDHYPGMGRELYRSEPVFRHHLDRCAEELEPWLDADLRDLLYPHGTEDDEDGGAAEGTVSGLDLKKMLGRGSGESDPDQERLSETRVAQPTIFAVEYALAKLWMSWGVEPKAMIGYSLGEYVAACLAGVLSLSDALALVAQRARLIQDLPSGRMLAVPRGAEVVAPLIDSLDLSLAAINGPDMTVLAGTEEAVEEARRRLEARDVACQLLQNTHAFHSFMLEPASNELTSRARDMEQSAPEIPYVSNVTGTWITDEEATDPGYWARHMCQSVRFSDGLEALLSDERNVLLEVGPGQGLSSFARLHPACSKQRAGAVISSMRQGYGRGDDQVILLEALGRLWMAGATLDWSTFYGEERRRRVPLPTYPFERQRHWVDLPTPADASQPAAGLEKNSSLSEWIYEEEWIESEIPEPKSPPTGCWWIFDDETGLGRELQRKLSEDGADVVRILAGEEFTRHEDKVYEVRPGAVEDYAELYEDLAARGRKPSRILHLWSVTDGPVDSGPETFRNAREKGFYSLVFLVQALANRGMSGPLEVAVVGNHLYEVPDDELPPSPEKATILGPALVLPQEHPNWSCRCLDVGAEGHGNGAETESAVERLLAELLGGSTDRNVALRGARRHVRRFSQKLLESVDESPFRDGGVYLITGGMGGIGLALSRHLATAHQAKLVLTRRSSMPPREEWDAWIEDQEVGESMRATIREIRALEERGGQVLALQADVTDRERMEEVVEETLERFGALHGVVHAAGELAEDTFKTMQQLDRDACERQFAPKVEGLYVLDRVLSGIDLDFCLLYSSLSAILGGLGYAPYATANLFMDVFAQRRRSVGQPPWLSVDWDSWHYEGFGETSSGIGTTLTELAMTPEQGVEVLTRLLRRSERSPVVVSTGDLEARLDRWVQMREVQAADATGSMPRPADTELPGGDELVERIGSVWAQVLGVDEVSRDENFFDLGGNSLLGMQLVGDLQRELGVEVTPVMLFEAPTVEALAERLQPREAREKPTAATEASPSTASGDIAIIGFVGRFPGARDTEEFWSNLEQGVESIRFFSDEELLAHGTDPSTLSDPSFVKARPILGDVDLFDAAFFGYSPREAEVMDPQHRLFLEAAWEALESAGYDCERLTEPVGIYGGASISSYMANIYSNPELVDQVGTFQTLIGNEKDSLTTKVSYKMNLRGPSMAVQTFCSTSLVALHLARQALLSGDCHMALAGGISVIVPEVSGYHYQEGGIGSVDGHIRAFDAGGSGIVFGNGLGLVVLKRLEDAMADGDPIHAVVKASAVNNDGTVKAGYSATSVEGQAQVVASTFEQSGIHPEDLQYVEAHGTGTPLGDPIEVAALTRAFRAHTDRTGFCGLGSAKTNVGHLDRAAGITGLIKTVLALRHRRIPPSLHFEVPNPKIDFASSPFFVNTELRDWPADGKPRRAGVNSLGLGGTNAHVILEEAPEREPSGPSRPWQLLVLSAKTPTALDRATKRLAKHLEAHPEQSLADVAYTLQMGRSAMLHRRAVVCRDRKDALEALSGDTPRRWIAGRRPPKPRSVTFLFPGLGGQYVGMSRGLYEQESTFRDTVDRCADLLEPSLGTDLREILYPPTSEANGEPSEGGFDLRRMLGRDAMEEDETSRRLAHTRVLQPALFVVEYALARLWMGWGIRPEAMIGYSIGELVAATLAEVLSLEDALELVAERARLIDGVSEGRMLAVPLPEDEASSLLGEELSLAAVNGPEQSVVAGSVEAVEALEHRLEEQGVTARRLETRHAFHSHMLEPIFDALVERVRRMDLSAPRIPYLSNVTGTWITDEEATDPTYWARHMCSTVRFSRSVETLLQDGNQVLLEMGPGQTLGSLVLQHPASRAETEDAVEPTVLATLRHGYETREDGAVLLETLGRLWATGVTFDGARFWDGEQRHRVVLPTYPFERERFWVEAKEPTHVAARRRSSATRARTLADAFQMPSWRRAGPPPTADGSPFPDGPWWIFADEEGLATAVAERVAGAEPVVIECGQAALENLDELEGPPVGILYGREKVEELPSLLETVTAAAGVSAPPVWVLTREVHGICGMESVQPERTAVIADCRRISACRQIDVPAETGRETDVERLVQQVAWEVQADSGEPVVAFRGRHRWLPDLEPLFPSLDEEAPTRLREGGVYLIPNGLEDLGYAFAKALAPLGSRLVLLDGVRLPTRDTWEEALEDEDTNDLVRWKLGRVRSLEELGAEVRMVHREPTPEGLATAVHGARESHGPFHGVVQPVVDEGSLEDLEALSRAVDPDDLDFALLVSRTAATTRAARVSVQADAYAQSAEKNGPVFWTSVAWDPDLAVDKVLRPLLSLPSLSQIVVSSRRLRDPWERFLDRPEPRSDEAPSEDAQTLYPRPSLEVEYVEPRTSLERLLVVIWEDLLGVEQVGIHDSFLELGGDSLIAARLVARMREELDAEIPLRLFFERSTVAELAEAVEELRRRDDEQETAELLEQIEGMSPEEMEEEILRLEHLEETGE